MAPHSSTLAWKIPWMEEPGRLQSMGSQRVRHDWAISLSLFTFMHWRRKCNPLQCSCLENPRDGVTQSWKWLKWLSSSKGILLVQKSCSRETVLAKIGTLTVYNFIFYKEHYIRHLHLKSYDYSWQFRNNVLSCVRMSLQWLWTITNENQSSKIGQEEARKQQQIDF